MSTDNQQSHEEDPKESGTKPNEYWGTEIKAAQKRLRNYRKSGDKTVQRFLDDRKSSSDVGTEGKGGGMFRLNFFHNNVITLQSMLYGRIPEIDVSRRYHDADDDPARVAAEIIQRMLQSCVEEPGETFDDTLRSCLQDRLLPGMGTARVRYEVETIKETVQIQAVDGAVQSHETEKMVSEDAPIEYVHWRDFSWGFGRKWSDVPWVSFTVYKTKPEVTERFGKEVAAQLQYTHRKLATEDSMEYDADNADPWATAKIYEIWQKKTKKVIWYAEEANALLDTKEDPLGLKGFFPCPEPMVANITTTNFIPRSDFQMTQDLYNEIDTLQTRISIITRAVKVVGLYDMANEGVQRMMKEGTENDMIPVDNWAMLAERGGIEGVVDWFPVQEVAGVLSKLQETLAVTIQLLYQVTGLSDILRGTLDNQYEGVAQTKDKAKFASIRVQALQEQFAKFASEALQLKAEVISKHFDERTIIVQSNARFMQENQQLLQAGLQLIKDPEQGPWRVAIQPESIAMLDYAQLQGERTQYLNGLSTFLQSGGALIKEVPSAGPVLMELLKWGLAGFKGSQQIEGVLDKAIEQAKNAPPKQQDQNQGPSPQEESQAKITEIQAKAQADMAEQGQKHQNKLQEIKADHISQMQQIMAESETGNLREQLQAYYAILEKSATTEDEIEKIEAAGRVKANG